MKEAQQSQLDRMLKAMLVLHNVDYFNLPVYVHFHTKPLHIFKVQQDWDVPKILKEHRSSILRSQRTFDPAMPEDRRERCWSFVLRLADSVYCCLEVSYLLVYAPTPEIARKHGLRFLERYAAPQPEEEPKFHILSLRQDVVEIQAVKVVKPLVLDDENLQLHYGHDAPQFER